MDKNEIISALQSLKELIQQYEVACQELQNFSDLLKKAESRQFIAVSDFDRKNKQTYVLSHIGPEPAKPKGIIKLAIPVYRFKMKAYKKEYADYKAKYDECVVKYNEEFADQRTKLESEEKAEISFGIKSARQKYDQALERVNNLKQQLNANTVLSDELKNTDSVETIIGFLQYHRADSIKEAVNLYYEEEHRRRLEEITKEQARLIAEATNLAQIAIKNAEEATSKASEVISRVDIAVERANEAYEKAEEAYNEAQRAYWAASSNSN